MHTNIVIVHEITTLLPVFILKKNKLQIMTKDQTRYTIGKKSRNIGLGERTEATHNIFSTIELEQIFINSTCIALYVALHDEVATLNIIERWYDMGKRVVLPRIAGSQMDFVEYRPGSLQKGAFGILEPTSGSVVPPSEIELMILPGVAFCGDGRRLGRGGGYYDRYLSQSDFHGYTIGIGYSHQLLDDIPCEEHDVSLSKVITASKGDTPQLSELIVRVIDSASSAANTLGCGVERLISMGLTWVLSRFSIEIYNMPSSIDNITIETWIEDCKRIATTRNFIITDQNGEKLGVATSQWCMIDIKARRPVDLTTPDFDYTKHIQPRNIDIERPRKIPQLDSFDGEVSTSYHTANGLDIDINNHVNTMRYIELMLAMVEKKHRLEYSNTRVDIHFANESLLGDELIINHKKQLQPESQQLLFEIIRPNGTPSVRALFNYKS